MFGQATFSYTIIICYIIEEASKVSSIIVCLFIYFQVHPLVLDTSSIFELSLDGQERPQGID